jgi:hypothetical protein
VFRREGHEWNLEVELIAPDLGPGDTYGHGVAVRGSLAVVGAPDHDGATERCGAAYVFRRENGVWSFEQKLSAADPDAVDQFGWSVAIAGTSIVIGARGDSEAAINAGAVYAFEHDGAAYVQRNKLPCPSGSNGDGASFGFSLAADENRFVVGAPFDGGNHGAAYVFRRGGGAWVLERALVSPAGPQPERFGLSVAVLENLILVGAPRHVVALRGSTGVAFGFERIGGVWTATNALLARESAPGDQFGYAVALIDGAALVGAYANNGSFGSAYVFDKPGQGWVERAALLQSDFNVPDPLGAPPYFGFAIASAGDWALIAAPHDDNGIGGDAGAVYAFAGIRQVDCDKNGTPDGCDIAEGRASDFNRNGVPDRCEGLGDVNCDGALDAFDIEAFILALLDPVGYANQHPNCDRMRADINGDGPVDAFDIALFVALLGAP